jgi:hypothetical protein
MKSKIIIWLTLFIGLMGYAQPIIKWEKAVGGTKREYGIDVFVDSQQLKFFSTSFSDDYDYIGSHGERDAWVFNLDLDGNFISSKNFGGSKNDNLSAVNHDISDYYLMGGSSFSTDGDFKVDSNSSGIFLAQIDKNDSLLVNFTLPLSQYHQLSDIVQMNKDKFMIAGRVSQQYTACFGDSTYTNAIFLKGVDRQGNELWRRCWPGQGGASRLYKFSDNEYVFLVGNSSSVAPFVGESLSYILFIDSMGNDIKQFSIGCDNKCGMTLNSFLKLTDTTYSIFIGLQGPEAGGDILQTNGTTMKDSWFGILDSNGEIIHQQTFPGLWDEDPSDMIVTSEGDVILMGSTSMNQPPFPLSNGGRDIWVIKLNNIGQMIWQKNIGGSYRDLGVRISEVSSGLYVIAGWTESNDKDIQSTNYTTSTTADAWVIMLEDTAITNQLTSIANMDFGFKIFPNPTNSMLTIQTDAALQNATATLTNLEGRVMFSQALANSQQQSLDIGHLPNGMYFVTVQSEQQKWVRRVVKAE